MRLRVGPLNMDGLQYVFEVSLLQVEEGIVSNLNCVLLVFLAFYVIRTHRRPASARYIPLGDYSLVTVGPLSTRPLSACRHSFSLSSHATPFHWFKLTTPSRGPSLAIYSRCQ
jgi:hypothetical protein